MTLWTGHFQTVTSRTGSSSIAQIGHFPLASPTTSGCMGQVQEIGGSCAAATATTDMTAATRNTPIARDFMPIISSLASRFEPVGRISEAPTRAAADAWLDRSGAPDRTDRRAPAHRAPD